jgi:hypothetical protein
LKPPSHPAVERSVLHVEQNRDISPTNVEVQFGTTPYLPVSPHSRNLPPPFCNTPSANGTQLTFTPPDVRSHHHSRYTQPPRPTISATTPIAAHNPRRRKTPPADISHKPAPVSISCLDSHGKMCILMNTTNVARAASDTRQVSPTKVFDNSFVLTFPCLQGPQAHDSPFSCRSCLSWFPTIHHRTLRVICWTLLPRLPPALR